MHPEFFALHRGGEDRSSASASFLLNTDLRQHKGLPFARVTRQVQCGLPLTREDQQEGSGASPSPGEQRLATCAISDGECQETNEFCVYLWQVLSERKHEILHKDLKHTCTVSTFEISFIKALSIYPSIIYLSINLSAYLSSVYPSLSIPLSIYLPIYPLFNYVQLYFSVCNCQMRKPDSYTKPSMGDKRTSCLTDFIVDFLHTLIHLCFFLGFFKNW